MSAAWHWLVEFKMTEWLQTWELLIGAGIPAHELGTGQIIMRSLIVFVASLFMIRVGARRFLARKTAFDLILAFIFGSMLSRSTGKRVSPGAGETESR